MDNEILAVAEINSLIGKCPRLKALINSNDKTPLIDGQIDIYDGILRSNEEWVGSVDVQVKGKLTPQRGKFRKSYPISRTDLTAYMNNSGVLYFAVSIDRNTGDRVPYYAFLSPAAIERILDRAAPTTKQISVAIKPFPSDAAEIERIVRVAYKAKAERPSSEGVFALLPQMKSITVHTAEPLGFDSPVALIPGLSDHTLVLNTHDGLSLPIGGELHIYPGLYSPQEIDISVSCGDVSFTQATVQKIDEEHLQLTLSDGITLVLHYMDGLQSMNANFTSVSSFPTRLQTLEFYAALVDQKPLMIDGQAASEFEVPDGEDDQQIAHLAYLRKLSELFELLKVDTQIVEYSEIDDSQHAELQRIYRALTTKEEFTRSEDRISYLMPNIGHWKLMLVFLPGSTPGTWRCFDPFAAENRDLIKIGRRELENGESEEMPVTVYEILDRDNLPLVLNLHLDEVVKAYEVLENQAEAISMATQMVLRLLSTADTENQRKYEFLGSAERLNEWIISRDGEAPNHLINRWQIMHRRKPLSPEIKNMVRSLRRKIQREQPLGAGHMEVACALLLGDQEEAAYCFSNLTADEKDQFKNWPIWTLSNSAAQGDSQEPAEIVDVRSIQLD
ncbi:hypothetical protein ACFWHR_09350 [Leucobacter sp. NPDC058333]|uniref:hypothetical protein n=1 Tax=Leucobacter sp. NPDC058333 TaxID=3346450 RepID=UPI003649F5FB